MQDKSLFASSRFSVLAVAGFLTLAGTTGTALALGGSELPEFIDLTGVVRDFPESHPDFENPPDHGYGHYAGSIELFIGPGYKPAFNSGGYKVLQEWRDSQGRPIAPQMFNKRYLPGTGESPNNTTITLTDDNGVDAVEISWKMTTFNEGETSTWVYQVMELDTGNDLSHWTLSLPPGVGVLPGTTPGYDLGLDGSTGFYGIKWDVDDEFSFGEFVIVLDNYYFGMDMPAGVLAKGGSEADVGPMFAPTQYVSDTGSPFNTEPMLIDDFSLNDEAGQAGAEDNGGVTSGATFYNWFRDEPGVNLSNTLTLRFQLQDDGTYVFDDTQDPEYSDLGGFFPIEDELLGNPGGTPDRNFHFTFEMHAEFTYDSSANQFFRFVGDDDVFAYIDGKLAIDLGGVHSATEQFVDLNRYGLTDGETYRLDFFFAERHRTQSNFRIVTNLLLEDYQLPSISAAFD